MATMSRRSERAIQAMNPYGRRAMDYAREHCPGRYATIADPASYFQELGEQIRTQVSAAQQSLAQASGGPDATTPDGWISRLGQENMATLMIEERVFSTMVYEAMAPEEDPEDLAAEAAWEPLIPDMSDLLRADAEEMHY